MKANTIFIILAVIILVVAVIGIGASIEQRRAKDNGKKKSPCGPKPWFKLGGTVKCVNGKWVSYSCGPAPQSPGNWRCAGGTAWVNIDSKDSMAYFLKEYAGLGSATERMTDDQLRTAIINF